MISIVITTKDREDVFKKSFQSTYESAKNAATKVNLDKIEIIIVSPTEYSFLHQYKENPQLDLKLVKDEGKGKPEALNLAADIAKGEYIVFTDGDVILDNNAISALFSYLKMNNLSIAGGKVVPLNLKTNMLGYWAWTLVDGVARRLRENNEKKRKENIRSFFPVSGYLYILKKDLLPKVPSNILSDDAFISFVVFSSGELIGYCDSAIVYVMFPQNFGDYIKQKIRSVGGYQQKDILKSRIRTPIYEAMNGTFIVLSYAKSIKEFFWSVLLLLSRVYLWVLIIYKVKIRKQKDIWKVVSTSKNI